MKKLKVWVMALCLLSVTSLSWGSFTPGVMDIAPLYFMNDSTSPYAVHFSTSTSLLTGLSAISAQLRMSFSGGASFVNATVLLANYYCWDSSTGGSGRGAWDVDGTSYALRNPFTITNSTAGGWLIDRSTTFASWGTTSVNNQVYGVSSIEVRYRIPGSGTNYDLSIDGVDPIDLPITGLDPTGVNGPPGGWIAGTLPDGAANVFVLVKDTANRILGTYISEPNGVGGTTGDGYSQTSGYFRVAVPTVSEQLTFVFLNNDESTHTTNFSITTSVTTGNVTYVQIALLITPSGSVVLNPGGMHPFTASGGSGTYTWSLSTNIFGSINTTAGNQVTFTASSVGSVNLILNDGTNQTSVTINIVGTSAPLAPDISMGSMAVPRETGFAVIKPSEK